MIEHEIQGLVIGKGLQALLAIFPVRGDLGKRGFRCVYFQNSIRLVQIKSRIAN